MMELIDVWEIEIISKNEETGEEDFHYFNCDSMILANRYLNTFKPKRNYEVIKATIDKGWKLPV